MVSEHPKFRRIVCHVGRSQFSSMFSDLAINNAWRLGAGTMLTC